MGPPELPMELDASLPLPTLCFSTVDFHLHLQFMWKLKSLSKEETQSHVI